MEDKHKKNIDVFGELGGRQIYLLRYALATMAAKYAREEASHGGRRFSFSDSVFDSLQHMSKENAELLLKTFP